MAPARRRWYRRVPLLLFFAALLAIVVWALLPPPQEVEIGRVVSAPMRVTVDEDGQTRIKERYVVSSPLTGLLLRIELDPGDLVEKGSLLASIEPLDPQLLDARTQAEAQARVRAAEAALARSRAELERAEIAYEYALTDAERAHKLIEKGAISQEEFDRADQAERATQEQIRAARFSVQVAEHELELSQAAVSVTQRPRSSRRLEIRAPVSGRILRVFQESAAVVSASQPLLELGDPVELEVVVDVLSSDGVRIKPGARVLFEHWGGDDPLTGHVRLVEPSAFTKVSALGVDEQRVNVIIDLDRTAGQPPQLGDAFRVEARIVTWESDSVLVVPLGSLFREGDEWAVFRVREGRALLSPVRIGHRNSLNAEVLEGLEEGDTIILHPSDGIRNGVRVEPSTT